jgi:polysaccharide pyruvyl transferase WcaK-like protein
MDVVLTTRLHGTVLALKNSVPAIALDPIAGGAKIRRQAETVGWPVVFTAGALTDEALQQAFDYCLTEDAQMMARECCKRAISTAQGVREQFISSVARPNESAGN